MGILFTMKDFFAKRLFMLLLVMHLIVSNTCTKLEKAMLVSTGEVTNILTNKADASGLIIDLGDGATQHGHCYAITPNVTIDYSKTQLGVPTATGGFTSQLSNLQAGTRYYIKAYISNGTETVYGTETNFTTVTASIPTITTTAISSVTTTSASSGGNISSDGGAPVTARGVCWNTSPGATIANSKTTDGTGTGNFTSTIAGLTTFTTYYVRAYATNNAGTVYGNEIAFTTLSSIPTISTTSITDVTSSSAKSGGNITNNGGTPVSVSGICWSINTNPTVADMHTVDGTPSGTFISNLTGLAPGTSYYVRAYATNNIGTAYGVQISFTTSSSSVTCSAFQVTHTAGLVAPVTKTVNYGTVLTNLTGSNKCWITQNLGADNQAVSATDVSESAAGWYWQFNKQQGYKHDGGTRTPNITWITAINENSNWTAANDPCAILLGTGWRIPTQTEWTLADATGGWSNFNDIYASVLKLHIAGFLLDTNGTLIARSSGGGGGFWSSTQNTSTNTIGWNLIFDSGSCDMSSFNKANGSSIRCIKD
jgi:uncharacterized protein (TIGR02145 family)